MGNGGRSECIKEQIIWGVHLSFDIKSDLFSIPIIYYIIFLTHSTYYQNIPISIYPTHCFMQKEYTATAKQMITRN
jgi:hypothetical protein